MTKEKESYEKELQVIDTLYGVGRKNRMKELVVSQTIVPESIAHFMRFTDQFGKVADDLALFINDSGHLLVSWSFWELDPARQRRGALTRRLDLEFLPTHISYFRYGLDQGWTELDPDGEAIKALVELHRSCRPALVEAS